MPASSNILAQLMFVILDRQANPSPKSYTCQLLSGGMNKIGGKILEEAREVVEAAEEPEETRRDHVTYEAADLIYHLWVLLADQGIPLQEVENELARRFGMSGLEEKASRNTKPNEE